MDSLLGDGFNVSATESDRDIKMKKRKDCFFQSNLTYFRLLLLIFFCRRWNFNGEKRGVECQQGGEENWRSWPRSNSPNNQTWSSDVFSHPKANGHSRSGHCQFSILKYL